MTTTPRKVATRSSARRSSPARSTSGTPRRTTPQRPPRATPLRATTPKVRASPARAGTSPMKQATPTPHVDPAPNENGEEGIVVAIRMRPLNAKESTDESATSALASRVWRVLPQYNSVTQTTNTGQPLPERVTGRTFFSFDRTFGEDATTQNVYDGVAKNIVQSVVTGLNGTIFAYGQTSSGKTFTMQGSGSIDEGRRAGGGGVVHMAAMDIFGHIQNTPDRIFLVRTSFIEIYNEEVRDLLGGNAVLQVREDPRKGVFVNANEEIVTDFESLLRILFAGEKNRAVAATGMNERSSRSHTIFRITIESRQKTDGNDSDSSSDEGAVLISTLNLVDLAGSESVRHTGATGERQKEGAKINQSLLTLSRVIVGLGQPNQGHINFRDSKLTRILQPSLSGNARMAVVCCATPSELYLEETRSTLLFASRAKLVKTKAQVNEVLDDRSMIKRLQRELAEARRQSSGTGQIEHMKSLESQAAMAGSAAKAAEEKLRRLKSSLLNSAVIFGTPLVDGVSIESDGKAMSRVRAKKRRLSDGHIHVDRSGMLTPLKENGEHASPQSLRRPVRTDSVGQINAHLSPNSELALVRTAYDSKVGHTKTLQGTVSELERNLETKSKENETLMETVQRLESEKAAAEKTIADLQSEKADLLGRNESLSSERVRGAFELAQSNTAREKLSKELLESKQQVQQMSEDLSLLKATLKDAIEEKNDALKKLNETRSTLETVSAQKAEAEQQVASLKESLSQRGVELESARAENIELTGKNGQLEEDVAKFASELEESEARNEDLTSESAEQKKIIEQLEGTAKQVEAEHYESMGQAEADIETQKETIAGLEATISQLTEEKTSVLQTNEELSVRVAEMTTAMEKGAEKVASLESELKEKTVECTKKAESLEDSNTALADSQQKTQELEATIRMLHGEKDALDARVVDLSSQLEDTIERFVELESRKIEVAVKLEEVTAELESVSAERQNLSQRLEEQTNQLSIVTKERDEALASLESAEALKSNLNGIIERLEEEKEEMKSNMEILLGEKSGVSKQVKELAASKAVVDEKLAQAATTLETLAEEKQSLIEELQQQQNAISAATQEKEALEANLAELQSQVDEQQASVQHLEDDNAGLVARLDALSAEKADALSQIASLESIKVELEAQIDDYEEKSEGYTAEKEQLEAKLNEYQTTERRLQDEYSSLESQLEAITTERNDALGQVASLESSEAELQNRLNDREGRIEQLVAEKETLMSQFEDRDSAFAALAKERDEAVSSLTSLNETLEFTKTEVATLHDQIDELETEKAAKFDQFEALSELKQEVEARLEESQQQIQALREERDSLVQARDLLSSELSEFRQEQANISAKDAEDMQVKLQALESETDELKQLLADSNEKVTEAREEARAASLELQHKMESLEEAVRRQADLEEELRSVSERAAFLESSANENDLPSELEALMQEKLIAEARLQEEMERREEFEGELRRLAGEEQRALVLEAENTMGSLRTEIEELRSTLSQTEAEVYAARQELEELQYQNRLLEDKALEADVLRETEKVLKNKVTMLSEKNSRLEAEMDAERRASISQDQHDEEVATVKAELSRVKAECYAATQEAMDLRSEISQARHEKEKALREAKLSKDDFLASIASLESENQELHSQIRKLEVEDQVEDKENFVSIDEVSKIQKQLKEMSAELESKDERIQHLEKTKLTKSQCAALKKIKEERGQFAKDVEEYRVKLADAQKEISQLTSQLSQVANSSGDGDASLKFEKEALETKFRKYAAHCQRLESEKALMKDALESIQGFHVEHGDVTGAVVAMVDRITSLEEECEALSSAENKASSYLSELDRLREENSALHESVSKFDSRLAQLTGSEVDLKAKVDELSAKVESLRRERDNLKSIAESARGNAESLENEKSRQVRYLEQENLQLMLDLKNAKKQLQNTRKQLDAARMKVTDDDTADFGDLPVASLNETSATDGGGVGDEFSAGWLLNPDSSQTDKENSGHNEDLKSPESSSKRRFPRIPMSAKKKLRSMTPGRSSAVGLGETSSDPNDENTQECKQS